MTPQKLKSKCQQICKIMYNVNYDNMLLIITTVIYRENAETAMSTDEPPRGKTNNVVSE